MLSAPIKIKTSLKNELSLMRSLVISVIGEDNEGKYNPRFVDEMLATVNELPTKRFTNKAAFLRQLQAL